MVIISTGTRGASTFDAPASGTLVALLAVHFCLRGESDGYIWQRDARP